jgi:NitT/TauT family transport system permease protein
MAEKNVTERFRESKLALWATRLSPGFYPLISVVAMVISWEAACHVLEIPRYILPAPSAISLELWKQRWVLLEHSVPTLLVITLGFVTAFVLGLLLAILIAWSTPLKLTLYPILISSQTVPKVAIAPLLVLWLGYGIFPKVMITFLVCFFPITIDAVVGLRSVPPETILLARSTGAGGWKTLSKIQLPHALPNIFAGLKVAITLAVVGSIVAEFVGADGGLGYLLMAATGNLDTTFLFADLVVLVVIGIMLYVLIEVLESACIPWHVSKRGDDYDDIGSSL